MLKVELNVLNLAQIFVKDTHLSSKEVSLLSLSRNCIFSYKHSNPFILNTRLLLYKILHMNRKM